MKALTAREVQLGELEILKKLDELCSQLGLRYFLTYGTLLGAVRHKGFIPWDDDVDITMPRPDYEKLIEYLQLHEEELAPFKLMHYKTNKKYIYPISRFVDTRYWIDYQGATDYGLGLFVDIYPLDGCGNTVEQAKKIMQKNKQDVVLMDISGRNRYKTSISGGFLRSAAKLVAYWYAKLRGARYFARKLDKKGQKYKYDECDYVNLTIWSTTVKFFKKEWFATIERIQFEDSEFCVPKRYHEILTQCYGDYMKLPPEEQQIAHHYYTAYIRDEAE